MDTKPERQSALIGEITRYLAAVEVFRSVGCEPTWVPESARPPAFDEPLLRAAATAPSAH